MSHDKQDYYAILGVARHATDAMIKKAFRDKAIKHHPDKGGDAETFKAINEAHSVLTDKNKRAVYDQRGFAGIEHYDQQQQQQQQQRHATAGGHAGFAQHFPFADLFAQFHQHQAQQASFHAQMQQQRQQQQRQQQQQQQQQKSRDIHIDIPLTLEQYYVGCIKTCSFTIQKTCTPCKGTGCKSGVKSTCVQCGGYGNLSTTTVLGLGMMKQTIGTCPCCAGSGVAWTNEADRCDACQGKQTVEEHVKHEIRITPCMALSQKIVLSGAAGQQPNTLEAGDVHFQLTLIPHAKFKLIDISYGLMMEQSITLVEALTGVCFDIQHLDGTKLHVTEKMPVRRGCIQPGQWQCIRGKGLKKPTPPSSSVVGSVVAFGDLFIQYKIIYPDAATLTPTMQQSIRAALSPASPFCLFKSTSHTQATSTPSSEHQWIYTEQILDMQQEIRAAAAAANNQ